MERLGVVVEFGILIIGAVSCIAAPLIVPDPWPKRVLRCLLGTVILAFLWFLVYAIILVFFVHIG